MRLFGRGGGWRSLSVGCVAVAGCFSAVSAADARSAPEVRITDGRLRGTVVEREGDAGPVEAFLGIPFAAAPIADYRWKAPRPVSAWKGVRVADRFGPACIQKMQSTGRPPWTHEYMEQRTPSEDCLYLNVWRPRNASGGRLPVLVWLHGGGFVEGSASVPVYDGAAIAGKGVIVVSINYRLGALGFLAHPDLTAEAGSSGNYGMMDVVAALRWVRSNIGAFGGDPARVTLAGQSAGSMAVHTMMASPAAKGYFARAIAQSGSGIGQLGSILPLETLAEAERKGQRFASLTGATGIAQLRKLSTFEILRATDALPSDALLKFVPVVDGRLVADTGAGAAPVSDVPILTGLNADENSGGLTNYNDQTDADLAAKLRRFGSMEAEARSIYPDGTNAALANKELLRDQGVAAMALWARSHARASARPTYLYLFRHVEPGAGSQRYGAFHSSEIPYVFSTFGASPERGFQPADFKVSELVSRYWVNFIKTGNPNGSALTSWPAFEPSRPTLMQLDVEPGIRPILDERRLDFYGRFAAGGGWFGIL